MQALTNIGINSLHAMTESHSSILKIKAENFEIKDNFYNLSNGKYIKISISDNGCGISQKNLKRIFEPFFTTKEKSLGLGLSIVYGIVQRHQGKIIVESTLKQGTTVTIILPQNSQSQISN